MKKTIRDYNLENKKVLIRCDFNVPLSNGQITDDNRIKESLPTIKFAIDHQAKTILLSHLGRVKEESDLAKNNLAPIADRLSKLLLHPVIFCNKTRGIELENAINLMNPGDVLLIQNTRYEDLNDQKESTNNKDLAKYWASLGDIFINDAFGTIHRSHASNVGIGELLPNGIGFLIEKELKALEVLNHPTSPFIVLLGGAKVADKIGVIENFIKKADSIIIGGGMAFTFLKAKGYEIGKSLVDPQNIAFAKEMLDRYPNKIVLPVDVNVTTEFSNTTPNRIASVKEISPTEMGMDLGPNSIRHIKTILTGAKLVLWNGPLGVYEMDKYQYATKEILEYLASTSTYTVLGGGDIVASAGELGYKDKVSHASTGGGATLEYLEGKILPGLSIINERVE
ncbi:MAG: phosphoglycerate kinase [Bacilli bacterium]